MQGIIDWHRGDPPQTGLYNIIYKDARTHEDKLGFATWDGQIWRNINGNVFVFGLVIYYGVPELVRPNSVIYFTTQTTAKLCGVKRRMFHYWIRDGKIKGKRDKTGNRWLFSLQEINRIRRMRGYKMLTRKEAEEEWRSMNVKK
jgi:excisionase family DNA binding protein